MSKIINKKQLDLVIESTMVEMGLKMEKEEKCPECGHKMNEEGLCEAGCGSMDYMEEEGKTPETEKEKKFAALAEPKDKITYADKIAGATKNEGVVEMSVNDLAESVTKTFNPSFLTEDMDNFKKLINYKNK